MVTLAALGVALAQAPAAGQAWQLGPQQIVQDGAGDLDAGYYSVPSYVDWDHDGANDLLVGESTGKVRWYRNQGSAAIPLFNGHTYLQAGGSDLQVPFGGCLGAYPRTVDWNGDTRTDLLVGDSAGGATVFLNTSLDPSNPVLDAGQAVRAGSPPADIDVGDRAAVKPVDWDGDGVEDLLMGDGAGNVRFYYNSGTNSLRTLEPFTYVQDGAGIIDIGSRASPEVADLDADGYLDLLVGDGDGKIRQYINQGTDPNAAPVFGGWTWLQADGSDIVLTSRVRPFVCDWTGDGRLDLLAGDYHGNVYLYEGVPEPATLGLLAAGGLALACRRRRA
jgi:hypothetical protein